MNFSFKPLLLAALVAASSLSAQAQTVTGGAAQGAPPQAAGPLGTEPQSATREPHGHAHGAEHSKMHADHMQQRAARRLERLKTLLQITPQQEGAWQAFAAAMQPDPAAREKRRAARQELHKLTTPGRIDRLRALRAERNAAMDRRLDGTKAFYAQLQPLQQQAFDQIAARRFERWGHGEGRGGHHGHHGMHGRHGDQGSYDGRHHDRRAGRDGA